MKHAAVKILFFALLLITMASVAAPTHWIIIRPGLEYTKIGVFSGFRAGTVHAFRVDLAKYELRVAIAEDKRNKIASVKDLTVANQGVIGINGGFFSQELKPLGLRIARHIQRSPLKATPWWGVFYVVEKRPYIVSQKQFKNNKSIEFAVQSGPRLIDNGKVLTSLRPGVDSRTALGITRDKRVLLVVTENINLTTAHLARLMQAPQVAGGLGCVQALNLDGGSSTQLYAQSDSFSVEVSGSSAVTDAVLVIPRVSTHGTPFN